MRLKEEPFRLIQSGKKKIECRLHDEKRQQLQVGDVIEFQLSGNDAEKFEKTIAGLRKFASFEALFEIYPEERCDMSQYYSVEDENKYGVLAIELK